MCNQDNTDSFGAPRRGGIVGTALSQMRPSARGPAAPSSGGIVGTALSQMRPSARGPAPTVGFNGPAPEPTGLASLTPSARGPRNRRPRGSARGGMEF